MFGLCMIVGEFFTDVAEILEDIEDKIEEEE